MSFSLQKLRLGDAAWLSTLTTAEILTLCELEGDLPPIPSPVFGDPAERDRVARACRESFLIWCETALREEGLVPAAHHRLLIRHLQAVVDGHVKKLMIFMPPGSGKSKFTSELLPAWFKLRRPGEPLIGASHTVALARRFSGRVQRYVRAFSDILGYGVSTSAKDRWEDTQGGEYLAVGVGGSLPGYRAGLAIVDDPFSGREDADSANTRDQVWSWWFGDLLPRIKPSAGIILMHTRWHEDDLAGRLLEAEPGEWTVLKLPAVSDGPDDPLGRPTGTALWADDDYGYGRMILKMRDTLEQSGSAREWQSQYQQNPRPAAGTLFQTARIEILDVAPNLRGATVGSGWDMAATRKVGTNNPDWTVRVKMARLASGLFVVLDVFRERGGPDDVENWLMNISTQDRIDTPGVTISLPQDPGQAGKSQALGWTRMLSGHRLVTSLETGDKATRASGVIAQSNGGNLALVRAPWNRALLDELGAFPSGAKDDQVDALSRAFGLVGIGPRAVVVSDAALDFLRQRR